MRSTTGGRYRAFFAFLVRKAQRKAAALMRGKQTSSGRAAEDADSDSA